ncbi:MAG: chromosome segregation protein SMC [Firmicutes bacterium]|nr:chromosome segregation protein SMC [Bacillota bacterium]
MYLKRMELLGFKSFPTKTPIEFGPGISCIVGPNGSGKSNVADALRWVLGEQSTKMLRGGKLEDVIFSGSKNRSPLGMAEVRLILDNSDHTLPVDFAEVEVSRRNFRGGVSEYSINNRNCRLKDILDLFVDTGVGADGLSLINQGRINELISVRPEERRALVEEAAGIVKYRNRKKDASRKLAETERHLERIGDIIGELSGRLQPLRLQSAKAEEYLRLKKDADNSEIALSVKILDAIKTQMEQIDADTGAIDDRLLTCAAEQSRRAAAAEALRLELAGLDDMVQQTSQQYYDLQARREQCAGELNLARSRRENAAAQQSRLRSELDRLEEEAAALRLQGQELAADLAAERQHAAELQEAILSGAGGEQANRQAVAALAEKLEEKKAAAYALASSISGLRNDRNFQTQLKSKAQARLEKLERQNQEFADAEAQKQGRIAQIETEVRQIQQKSEATSRELAEKQNQLRQSAAAHRQLAEQEAEYKYQAASLKAKTAMLREMVQSYEGFYPGVRELLRANRQGQAPAGVIDAAANILDVPVAYQVAVETYLAGSLQNIVCRSAQAAKAGIAWLKQNRAGRATFLPLDRLQPRRAEDYRAALDIPGVLGCGADLVQCPPEYAPVKDYLLNRMLIVKDMDAALQAAAAVRYRAAMVTLDGDMVSPGGSMTGGFRKQKSNELLGQKHKLAEAEKEAARAEAALTEMRQKLTEAQENMEAVSQAIDGLNEVLRQTEQNRERLQGEGQRLSQEIQAGRRLAAGVDEERRQMLDEIAEAEEAIEELSQTCRLKEQEEQERAGEIAALEEAYKTKSITLDENRAGVAQKKEDLAALKQKLQTLTENVQKNSKEQENISWEQEEKAADLADAEKDLAEWEAAVTAQEKDISLLTKELQAAKDLMEEKQHGLAAQTGELNRLDQEEKHWQKQLEQNRQQLHQLELKKARLEADWHNEEEKLQEKFQLSFEQAAALPLGEDSKEALNRRLHTLRQSIAAIGNVNLDAIEECREVEERYDFLSGQRDDLVEADRQLKQVIEEMDAIMSSRFRKAFTRLSQEFNESFRRLFGGGEAALVLCEPERILETGVELSVHLPGKKISNYNLLSGGEKSMIGIALLFAMLAVRPTPFCMMDEVDAALDEANIQRFTDYLQEQAGKSQFVMITHRQSTMEAASALWGVTMEEEGVSKIVSVKLNQND